LLAILSLLLLIVGSLWVLQPFIAPLVWAAMIAVATWPVMLAAQRKLWRMRSLAVVVMLLGLLLIFFVPLTLALLTLASHADEALTWARSFSPADWAEPPPWVAHIPMAGDHIANLWREAVAAGGNVLLAKVTPYMGSWATSALREVGTLGVVGLQCFITVAICGVLYARGEVAGQAVLRFAHRLSGDRGVEAVQLAASAVRGVALGVLVTALAQALLGGIGLWVAQVPGAGLLTAVMLLLAVAQVGPLPVLIGSVGWLFWSDQNAAAIGLLVWSGLVGTMDNVLRPWLIRKGADLPLLLIFAGVVGGLLAFGLIGIFVGPIVLAVTYTLLGAWMAEDVA
jgi:predicted PurR-regulated permease PerM